MLVPWEDNQLERINKYLYTKLGGGNSNIVSFHPYLGKIPILTNIFQRGWFNHQLENI